MYKIEHIGIAVKSLAESEPLFEQLLNTPPYKRETVEDQKVITSFFQTGESKVELLEATAEESPISKFILKKGEGIHHVAFEVDDIRKEMQRLREAGFQLLQDEPSIGADNKWVCFLHPKSANGVLIEICQSIVSAPKSTDGSTTLTNRGDFLSALPPL
jgi:methylmalonyl-CoA/ethylmalonyl-CoA epimerase